MLHFLQKNLEFLEKNKQREKKMQIPVSAFQGVGVVIQRFWASGRFISRFLGVFRYFFQRFSVVFQRFSVVFQRFNVVFQRFAVET